MLPLVCILLISFLNSWKTKKKLKLVLVLVLGCKGSNPWVNLVLFHQETNGGNHFRVNITIARFSHIDVHVGARLAIY